MKKYKNTLTGEIETVHAWDISKRRFIENNKSVFQELFEE